MSVVSVAYERQLGPVTALRPQQWTNATASGCVAICCANCGGIYDLPETHRVDEDDLIVPALNCEYMPCGAYGYVRLTNYREKVAR